MERLNYSDSLELNSDQEIVLWKGEGIDKVIKLVSF